MYKIDPSQAASFVVACEEGSIRSASERLELEPSTISRQIKSLEAALGVELIERGRKGVRPTQAGEMLQTYLKRQQSDQEVLLSEFDALKGMRRGQLVIAIGDGFIGDFVGNAVNPYMAAFPGITYDLTSGSTDQVLHALRTDHAHIGLAYNAPKERAIRTVAQAKQPLELLVSPSSPWADLPDPITLQDLENLPCAVLKSGFGIGDMIRAAERAHGLRLNAVMQTNSLAVLRTYISEGLGVSILPAFVASREIAEGSIIAKRLSIAELGHGEVSVLTRQGRRLPDSAVRLVSQITRSMVAFRP